MTVSIRTSSLTFIERETWRSINNYYYLASTKNKHYVCEYIRVDGRTSFNESAFLIQANNQLIVLTVLTSP